MQYLMNKALHQVGELHDSLGDSGRSSTTINRFGENAVLLDVEAEKLMINAVSQSGLPVKIVSEEHGVIPCKNGPAKFTVIMDGLDGSRVYTGEVEGPGYCSMLSFARGDDPSFEDSILTGIVVHRPCRQILVAVRGQGITIDDNLLDINQKGSQLQKHVVHTHEQVFETLRLPRIADYHPLSSLGYSFFKIVSEGGVLLDITHKQNLEHMIAFAAIIETGGVALLGDTVKNGEKMREENFCPLRAENFACLAEKNQDGRPLIIASSRDAAEVAFKILAEA